MFNCAAILVHAPFPWFGMSSDIDSGKGDLRLHSSRLFYTSVNLTQWFVQNAEKENFTWITKLNLLRLKKARRVKPEITCS